MRNLLLRVVVALIIGVWISGGVVRADLLINGNFESEPNFLPANAGYVAMTGTQIPGWTIASGHYATVHRAGTGNPTISGTYTVNTDGEGINGNNDLMYQDFASALGIQYQLAFTWEGWATNNNVHLNVSLTDLTTSSVLFDGLYTSDGLLSPHNVTANFAGTGDTLRLQVQETPQSGYNDNLFLVDNFSVNGAAVPEPASIVMLGTGAVVAAGWVRRRKARASAKGS